MAEQFDYQRYLDDSLSSLRIRVTALESHLRAIDEMALHHTLAEINVLQLQPDDVIVLWVRHGRIYHGDGRDAVLNLFRDALSRAFPSHRAVILERDEVELSIVHEIP